MAKNRKSEDTTPAPGDKAMEPRTHAPPAAGEGEVPIVVHPPQGDREQPREAAPFERFSFPDEANAAFDPMTRVRLHEITTATPATGLVPPARPAASRRWNVASEASAGSSRRKAEARDGRGVPDVGPSRGAAGIATSAENDGMRRAYSLDALRGFFLIVMTLGFTIQMGIFPEWMYHRQFPPPGNALVDIAGITWRDLAYAAFIFTMAAALPITLSRRIARGEPELGIVFAALKRGFMLFVFALLIGHANTYFIGYTQEGRAVAIAGFIVMFLLFTRRRADWNEAAWRIVRAAGWVAAIAFLAVSPLVWDGAFSLARRDDIIASLAVAAVAGSLVWYFTRDSIPARLIVLAGVVALYLGARGEGWLQQLWWSSPAPWLFVPAQLSLLTVVIPGTVAGDLVLRWMRAENHAGEQNHWSRGRLILIGALAAAFTPILVVGLYNRWVAETAQATVLLAGVGALLIRGAGSPSERLVRQLFLGAAAWLILGVILEPFEGGIRKVPETLSYFFTVGGITMMLLVTLAIAVDVLGRRGAARPLIEVGQNPMLCYVLFTVFLNSIFELVPALRGVLRNSPGESILRSLLTVVLVVVIVQIFTRHRVFWRT
jgi:hypothetical protein